MSDNWRKSTDGVVLIQSTLVSLMRGEEWLKSSLVEVETLRD